MTTSAQLADVNSRADKKPQIPAKAWILVLFLFLFFTLNFADKALIGLAATHIRHDLHLSASQYGLLSSAFFWLFALGAVALAIVLRKITYVWGGVLLMSAWVFTMLPLTVPTTFGVLLVSRMLLGFFEGPAHAFCQSVVADRFPPERRAFAGALVNSGSSIGPLVAAPTLTWVILTWSWHTAFFVLVVVGGLWILAWVRFTDRMPFRNSAHPGTRTTVGSGDLDPNGHIVVPFYRLLMLRSFWGLVLMSFAGYMISSLKVSWLPAYLHDGLGYSERVVGALSSIPYAAAVVVLLSAGLLSGRLLRIGYSARLARGALTGLYLLGGGVAMIAFTQTGAGIMQLILVTVAFSVNSVAFSVAFAGAADFLPARQRVAFFGCIIAAYSVAGIVAPYGLGLLVDPAPDPAQGYATGFLTVGIAVCVLGVLGALMLNPEKARADLERLSAAVAVRKEN
ncbi:MFS transporter [Nocardia veterana]|uniref:MFS transporter n=1 Tax=Nocardia veterana TaxID=132249 RepID=A0A7X6M0W1_9NOCA|nr:MFS transporter [Nocardia veterana]NKY87689.1 MFS transporter [Nocardia veterana]